ncbi:MULTISPECIES: DUF6088 family protein [unclassified Mesorhizobium]|uniref:DUF6088 family protein n=1 Tax=unclassified Mesorhizobium TaxID=325217 RepID=UPI0029621195|nr:MULTISPECIES: DUF6088 family protein [unclassified Mesorhizobium]
MTRRDNPRAVIDGMTAADDLSLTTAVPANIEVLVDARLKPIKLGTQEIHFNTRRQAASFVWPAGDAGPKPCIGCRTCSPRRAPRPGDHPCRLDNL